MSTMTETLQDESFFIPSEEGNTTETKNTPKVAGEYLGHITNLIESEREFVRDGRTLKAKIYNFKIHVASENATMKYTYQDKHGTQREHDGTSWLMECLGS